MTWHLHPHGANYAFIATLFFSLFAYRRHSSAANVVQKTINLCMRSFGNTMALSLADPQVALFLAYSLENMQRQIEAHKSGVSHLKNPLTDDYKRGRPSSTRQKSTREQVIDIFKATINSNKKAQSSEKARSNTKKKKSAKKNKSQKSTK
ncbi:hypothetical protein BG003_011282 [Podila horticola]|nr:hypothetical protein BG003_011282 [Podila horticola]